MTGRVSSNVSLPAEVSHIQQKAKAPKVALASRISLPFNTTQAAASIAIIGLISLPWAAAALFPSQHNPPSPIQLYNETCLPFIISPLVVAAYLRSGLIRAVFFK